MDIGGYRCKGSINYRGDEVRFLEEEKDWVRGRVERARERRSCRHCMVDDSSAGGTLQIQLLQIVPSTF